MYATRLVTVPIATTTSAPAAIGRRDRRQNSIYVPVVFTPGRGCCAWYVIIPKGFVCLVNKHGKYMWMWGAGFYTASPFISISHMVPTQYIIYDTPVKECPTLDNVMVTVDVTLVLRIDTDNEQSVYNFCYQLGPQRLDDMLRALQEEAIRGMARKRKYNEIYDLMDTKQDKQLDQTLRGLNDHFKNYGVEITSIAVTNVHLPREFAETMQEATVWHNRNEFKTLEQEFELQKIKTRELEAKSSQKAREDLEQFTAEKDKEVAELRKRKDLVIAQTNKILAEIREVERAEVLEIQTKAKLDVSEINAKRDVTLAQIRSQGHAEADKLRVESETYVKTKRAHAEAIVARNTAQCLALNAAAEMFAARQLQAKRQYEQRMRSLQTLRAVGANSNVAIAGNSGDNVLAQLLANQRSGVVLGVNQ